MINDKENEILNRIATEYKKDDKTWVIAYSGGKDSSCLLKLVIKAISQIVNYHKRIIVIFCDSGVDIPQIRSYALNTLKNLENETKKNGLPIEYRIVEPIVEERFFSKLIGKGYMPPYYKFRWCTERLRIQPIQNEIKRLGEITLLLGTRLDESEERKRTLNKHSIDEFHFRQTGFPNSIIFAPIVDYTVKDIWYALDELTFPESINSEELSFIYSGLHGDKNSHENCGRFGCWVCTVVRKDKALENLIKKGYVELTYLNEFKEFVRCLAKQDDVRETNRRDGSSGKGAFTLTTRKQILDELLRVQFVTGYRLIGEDEIQWIKNQWKIDEKSKIAVTGKEDQEILWTHQNFTSNTTPNSMPNEP